tara:strand:- start:11971 stop:12963 length:993 start_codon:yes stop_codon:yes gene_type:complete
MSISYLKSKLLSSKAAIFQVNKNEIIWSNNYFNNLFNFLNEYNLKNNITLKSSKNNFYLNLKINKESISYCSQLLIKNNKNSIYKINDEQIKYILALKEGMECFTKGNIKFAVQKQYNLNNLSISGYEYLARMYLRDGSQISNEHFMPVINSNYQLNILLPNILQKVAIFRKEHNKEINWINVSAELLEAKIFYNKFVKLIKNNDLNPKFIGIEITESHKIISNKNMIESLIKLKKDKFLIAMDDFGSGYANIRRLAILPIDLVKLDKSFIFDIKNKYTKTLIKGIVDIGKSIGFSVLAEGIENKSDLLQAKKLGVKFGQGWFIGKPRIL